MAESQVPLDGDGQRGEDGPGQGHVRHRVEEVREQDGVHVGVRPEGRTYVQWKSGDRDAFMLK